MRPFPTPETTSHWKRVLAEWAEDASLPLYVRKHSGNRGAAVTHATGRTIVPTDNSAAHWSYAMACAGARPTLDDIRLIAAKDGIPVAMVFKSAERAAATYQRTLQTISSPNAAGWKLAHIEDVGFRTQTAVAEIPLPLLKARFISFLNPSNMFLVPTEWAGLAEVPDVRAAFRTGEAL
jgi:hypothetical protein